MLKIIIKEEFKLGMKVRCSLSSKKTVYMVVDRQNSLLCTGNPWCSNA